MGQHLCVERSTSYVSKLPGSSPCERQVTLDVQGQMTLGPFWYCPFFKNNQSLVIGPKRKQGDITLLLFTLSHPTHSIWTLRSKHKTRHNARPHLRSPRNSCASRTARPLRTNCELFGVVLLSTPSTCVILRERYPLIGKAVLRWEKD
jgi:hypothetical protein